MRWGGAVLVVACCAVLAACGGSGSMASTSPTPITSSATPTSATPTPSTSASPTENLNTDAAVMEAVGDFVSAYEESARQASIQPFFGVTTPDCNCRTGVESLVSQLQAKSEHTDVTFKAKDVKVLSRMAGGAKVTLDIVNGPFRVISRLGHTIENAPAASNPATLNLRLMGGTWLVYLSS